MKNAGPVIRDLVLIGGGHSHVEVLRRFAMAPEAGVRLSLVTRDVMTPYSGMIPGYLAGHYRRDESHIDLAPLCQRASARLIHAAARGLDLQRRQVLFQDRPALGFDLLSIDIGSKPDARAIDGAAQYALPVKPIDRFLARWHAVESRIGGHGTAYRIVVIGAGAGGVELILSLQHRLKAAGVADAKVAFTLLSDRPEILPDHAPAVRARMGEVVKKRTIHMLTEHRATAITETTIRCADGNSVPYDTAILVNGAAPAEWLKETGLALDDRGFIRVSESLQSISHACVFAAGDIADLDGTVLPKAGVYAVRQGPALAENLRRYLRHRSLRPYRPQRRILALISTGDAAAVASYGRWSVQGRWVWRWKDWIDRRWMRIYQDPDPMPPSGEAATGEAFSGTAMRCGGCGAKVSNTVLDRVLTRLRPAIESVPLDGLVIGLGDDAAAFTVPDGKMLVQSVDHFRSFIDDPYLFGQITANHCLNDLYAMGATPHSALASVTLPYGAERVVEHDLEALLSGVLAALEEAGARLIGGHTGEGETMSLGLTVNGLAEPGRLIGKDGVRPGDRLILTKPLGTGMLFAAAMQGRARGPAVAHALARMAQANRLAMEVFLAHGVNACTDITGFGLLGHLVEMLKAGGYGARLHFDRLPTLPDLDPVIQAGIRSTLHPANLAFGQALANTGDDPRIDLLFDPQTAGGLLGSIPEAAAEDCRAALIAAGYPDAAIIGTVTEAGSEIELS